MSGEVERIYEEALTVIMLSEPEGSRASRIASRALLEAVHVWARVMREAGTGQPVPDR